MSALLYYLLIFVFIYFPFKYASKRELTKKDWVQIYVLLAIASGLLGIRFVISDWYTYMRQYEEVLNGDLIMVVNEPLWMATETAFAYFKAPYPVFFSFVYFAIIVILLNGIRNVERSILPVAAIMVFALLPVMSNIMRQMVAISIFIYSYRYVYERRLLKYCLLFLVAFNIHYSVLFFFPVYWLSKYELKIKPIVQMVIFLICSFLLSDVVMDLVLSQIGYIQMLGLLESFDGVYGLNELSYNTGFGKIASVITTCTIILCSDLMKKANPQYGKVYLIYYICICLTDSFGAAGWFISRAFQYGNMLIVILLPATYYVLKNKKAIVWAIVLIVFVIAGFVYHCFDEFYPGQTPLRFFWENSEYLINKYYKS